MSFNRSGYIGRAPGDSSVTIARKSYEPTGVQTDFTFSAGYDPGYCDVYLNGIRLVKDNDFTASDGSTVGLTSAANSGDVVEIVAYKAFNLGQSITDITGDLTITDTLTATNVSGTTSVTAGYLYGDGSNITGLSYAGIGITQYIDANSLTVTGSPGLTTITRLGATDAVVTGIITANGLSGNVSGVACTFTTGTFNGNVSIAGSLTYEDVTSVDSVGLITARAGIAVTGGQLLVGSGITMGIAGVATFSGTSDVHLLDNIEAKFGDAGDFIIKHNGSDVILRNVTGTGNIRLEPKNGELGLISQPDAETSLYYNNSKKIQTTNDGTVTTGIATATGGLEINADSKYLKIGAGADLQLVHNGTNSFVNNSTGHLYIRSGTGVDITNAAGSENYIVCTENGSVKVYYDHSNKFETTGSGTTTTGIGTFSGGIHVPNGTANGDNIALGNGSELQLWHNGTYSAIQADTFKVVDKSNGHGMITADADGAVGLRYDNVQKFATTNDGTVTTGIATVTQGLNTDGLLSEKFETTAGKLSDNTNIDLEDGMVHYFSTQESTTSTPNIRYSSSKSLNNMLSIGDAITVTIITTAASGGYSAQLTIDGSAVTEDWVGGSAPSAGGSDGLDIYVYTILKTASATYKVIGNLTNAT